MGYYKQLNHKDRCRLYTFLEMGLTKSEIAKRLARHRSTIYREIKRNRSCEIYLPGVAGKIAQGRRKERNCKINNDQNLTNYIIVHLKDGWSPEQISGRMRLTKEPYYVCHETIYRYIYRSQNKDLYQCLTYKRKKRGNKFGRKKRSCRYGSMRLIINRPKEIELKTTFGNWEADSIEFKGDKIRTITTLLERKTRMLVLIKNDCRTSTKIMDGIKNKFLHTTKKVFCTVTFDQGSEFANYYQLERSLNCRVFYCMPHSPWQKGGNENMNGRLRRYLPSDLDITTVTQDFLDGLSSKMNTTPRKCLAFYTPNEVYKDCCNRSKSYIPKIT